MLSLKCTGGCWERCPAVFLTRFQRCLLSLCGVHVFVCCVCVCAWVCGLGGYYCSLLVAAQFCLFCGTSVGCVMGFEVQCSVSGVKQAQSRALPDAMGTSGLVSLRFHTHAHMLTYYNMKTHRATLIHKHKAHSVTTMGRYPVKSRERVNAKENVSAEDLQRPPSPDPTQAGQISESCE